MPKRFAKAKESSAVIPLFEWAVDDKGDPLIERGRKDYDLVLNEINKKCWDWLNVEGRLIIHYSFGFSKVLNEETMYLSANYLKFTWKADSYTSVFGVVLDGTAVSRNSFLSDFCKTLNIDHFYALGLMHGLDDLSGYYVRTELKLNDSYKTGYEHGQELAERFVAVKGGINARNDGY